MEINIHELATELKHTRMDIDQAIARVTNDPERSFSDLTGTQCLELDSLVLKCMQCGWWEDASYTGEDEDGEIVCYDCKEVGL